MPTYELQLNLPRGIEEVLDAFVGGLGVKEYVPIQHDGNNIYVMSAHPPKGERGEFAVGEPYVHVTCNSPKKGKRGIEATNFQVTGDAITEEMIEQVKTALSGNQ